MPPKTSAGPRSGRTRSTAGKSFLQAANSFPTPREPSPPPKKDNQLHNSQSPVPETATGVMLSAPGNRDEGEKGTPAETIEIEPVEGLKLGKKKMVKKIVKKIIKKKVPKSVAKAEAEEAVLDSLDVGKAKSIEPETEYLEPNTAAAGKFQVEKGTTAAELVLGKDEMKDCEVSVAKDKCVLPISECNDSKDNIGSEKGYIRSVKMVKKIVKKKVPKLVSKNSARNEESEQNAHTETEYSETVGEAGDWEKGNSHPVEVGEGTIAVELGEDGMKDSEVTVTEDKIELPKVTIATEGILGKDGMKDSEVNVTEDKLALPVSDAKDNIGSLETGNIVLDSEKGNLRSVKIVKKIVKKKVPKLVARKNGKKEELVKGSKNEVAETILDSPGVEKSKPSPPGTENLESCKAVSTESEESKNLIEAEKATSVSEFGATENMLEPSILVRKDANVVDNDNMDSLETQTIIFNSEKASLDFSTSDNMDSSKGQNLGQLGEEGYSQHREEMKEAVDTSLRMNEGILLSGEMEALERKRRRRTEIFIGGLDKESKEDDLRKIFGEVGEVVDVRLVINRETGKNKGFAFLRYASAADAKKAVERYSKVEISGKQCGVSLVEGNDTIYLGNIDKKWKTEDVIELLKKAGIENIDKVTVMANPNNIEQNRGFAFVELETSKEAQIAFSKLQKKDALGKHVKVKVAWAQPLIEPNEEEMLKVKAVYAEYLPSSWDEEKVRDYFDKFGDIESIVLAKDLPSSRRKDFAFVNYMSRESALACIEAFSHVPANDSGSKVNMKVSLAKPMPKSKQTKRVTLSTRRGSREEKKVQTQSILKRPESSKKVNYMRRYDEGHRVDGGSSTTNELLHLLRQQGPARQLHSSLNMGINHQYSLSGSKRPFSAVVDNQHYMDSSGVSRVRLERSFPTANRSILSHSRGPLGTPSFAYYRQQGSGHFFQSHDRGPYGGYHSIYRRRE